MACRASSLGTPSRLSALDYEESSDWVSTFAGFLSAPPLLAADQTPTSCRPVSSAAPTLQVTRECFSKLKR
jgi:hypothetical protein